MKKGYQCDTCGEFSESVGSDEDRPWKCPVCGKEVCAHCFSKYATHKTCCEGKTDAELIVIADNAGFNFANK